MPEQPVHSKELSEDLLRIAEDVRDACIAAALEAYEHAKMSGLCDEGAWESAMGAIRMVDVESIVDAAGKQRIPSPRDSS